jgi:hypothetical protein
MTQTNNYLPTFLVAIFYQPKNASFSKGWGFYVTGHAQQGPTPTRGEPRTPAALADNRGAIYNNIIIINVTAVVSKGCGGPWLAVGYCRTLLSMRLKSEHHYEIRPSSLSALCSQRGRSEARSEEGPVGDWVVSCAHPILGCTIGWNPQRAKVRPCARQGAPRCAVERAKAR